MSGDEISQSRKKSERERPVIDYRAFNESGNRCSSQEDPLDVVFAEKFHHVVNKDGRLSKEGDNIRDTCSPHRGRGNLAKDNRYSPSYRSEVQIEVNSPDLSPAEGEVDREVARVVHAFIPIDSTANTPDLFSGNLDDSQMAEEEATIIHETPAEEQGRDSASLEQELLEADRAEKEKQERKERVEAVRREQLELERQARILADEMEVEQRQRKVAFLRQQITQLNKAREEAKAKETVIDPDEFRDDETSRKMIEMLEKLKREEELRKLKAEQAKSSKDEEAKKEANRKLLEQKQKEAEARERKKKEEEAKAKEATGDDVSRPSGRDDRIDQLLSWMEETKAKEKEQATKQQQVTQLQAQLAAMAKGQNTSQCTSSGVNLYANLETIQETGGVDLAAKANAAAAAAILAGSGSKRALDEADPDSDGEFPHLFHPKVKKLQSGLNVKVAHKVKVETEWAHHNLGREFEANPVNFNQLKLGQYMLGGSRDFV